MSKPPLIVDTFGNTLVADDSEDVALKGALLLAFGALKGLIRDRNGTRFVETESDLDLYREAAAAKVLDTIGTEVVEQYFGIKLKRGPIQRGPEGVQ